MKLFILQPDTNTSVVVCDVSRSERSIMARLHRRTDRFMASRFSQSMLGRIRPRGRLLLHTTLTLHARLHPSLCGFLPPSHAQRGFASPRHTRQRCPLVSWSRTHDVMLPDSVCVCVCVCVSDQIEDDTWSCCWKPVGCVTVFLFVSPPPRVCAPTNPWKDEPTVNVPPNKWRTTQCASLCFHSPSCRHKHSQILSRLQNVDLSAAENSPPTDICTEQLFQEMTEHL